MSFATRLVFVSRMYEAQKKTREESRELMMMSASAGLGPVKSSHKPGLCFYDERVPIDSHTKPDPITNKNGKVTSQPERALPELWRGSLRPNQTAVLVFFNGKQGNQPS